MRLLALSLLLVSLPSWACGSCTGIVDSLIYGRDFALNLLRMLMPVALVIAIALAPYFFCDNKTGEFNDD